MVSLELITDNNLLQEEMYRVAVAGYPVLAASAAISFPCVELALSVYAARGGRYWIPLWDELSGDCRRSFEGNDLRALGVAFAQSCWLRALLAGANSVEPTHAEQTLGMVARVWFEGASGIGMELDDTGAGWAIGSVDIVESFSVRHSFPWISDCVSENTTHPAILISRQMLCLAVEHRWSLSESYENGRHLADAFAPSVYADFGGALPR